MEFLVWTYFFQFDFVGSSIYIMEVAKVNKLSLELNKMGIKHIIFTLDYVSTKTFGDSTTLKRLKDSPERLAYPKSKNGVVVHMLNDVLLRV